MIRRLLLALAACALSAPALVPAALAAPVSLEAQRREEARLMQLFEADSRAQDRLDPLSALYRGGEADPAALALLFTDTLDRQRLTAAEQSLRAASRIDRTRLGTERRLSLDAFLAAKREQVRWLQPDLRALTAVRPFNHFGGLHVEFPAMVGPEGAQGYETEADYRRALALSGAFAGVLDTAIARFREGLASGVVEPQLTIVNMIAQIDAILAQPKADSPFYAPVLAFPPSVPMAAREPLKQAYAANLDQRAAFWKLREVISPAQKPEGGSIKHDVSVPVAAVPQFLAEADAAVTRLIPGARPFAFGHLGDGNIHYNVSQPIGVHGIVTRLGGSISAEHGIGTLKRDELPLVKDPVALDVMRAIKTTLDPLNIMNPGKVL